MGVIETVFCILFLVSLTSMNIAPSYKNELAEINKEIKVEN